MLLMACGGSSTGPGHPAASLDSLTFRPELDTAREMLRRGDIEGVERIAQQVLRDSKGAPALRKQRMQARSLQGQVYQWRSELDSALLMHEEVLRMAEAALDTFWIGAAWINIGVARDLQGDYAGAMQAGLSAMRWKELQGDSMSVMLEDLQSANGTYLRVRGSAHRFLQAALVQVVAARLQRARIERQPRTRKDVLPVPLAARSRVLARQRRWHVDLGDALGRDARGGHDLDGDGALGEAERGEAAAGVRQDRRHGCTACRLRELPGPRASLLRLCDHGPAGADRSRCRAR